MTKQEYLANKPIAALVGAIILWLIQLYVFVTGLHIGGDFEFVVGIGLWVALLIVQVVGNDFGKEDTVFRLGWLFSYLLEIGAGTYAIYNIIEIPATDIVFEAVRWVISLGLSGMISLLPERMLFIYLENDKKKHFSPISKPATNQAKPYSNNKQPDQRNNHQGKPYFSNPATGWKDNNKKPDKYDPLNFPTQKSKPSVGEPTYDRMRRLLEDDI